jgi:Asp-tRNA(Asn)/Glu-tRNA(Gln) amidotransferase A subunit family amidase
VFIGADQLALLDATAQADLVCAGEVTAVELVEAAIDRIDALKTTRRWLGPPLRGASSDS